MEWFMRKIFKKPLVYLLAFMMLTPTWLAVGIFNAPHAKAAGATLAEWNFADKNAIADSGSLTINSEKSITENASGDIAFSDDLSASVKGWDEGLDVKYWQVSLNSSGYGNLTLSSKQKSSATGPRDFKVQYSLDEIGWSDVTNGNIALSYQDYVLGTISNLSLPSDCNNKVTFYLRWLMSSNAPADSENYTEVGSLGTSRIDDIIVTGETLPSDLTTLNTAITSAQDLVNQNLPESTTPGDHAIGARNTLIAAIIMASAITSASSQAVVDNAVVTLNLAIDTYNGAIVPFSNLTVLEAAITVAQAKHDGAVEGISPGQYAIGSKAIFQLAIDTAKTVTDISAQSVVNDAVTALAAANTVFDAAKVPSPDASLTSEVYTIGTDTIGNVSFGTSKMDFLANLSKGEANQTWYANGMSDPVVTGDILMVMAEDGITTATYTVTVLTLEETATNAVVLAETAPIQANVDAAQILVTLLPDGEVKTGFQDRLDAVQAIVDANVIAAGAVSDLISALPTPGTTILLTDAPAITAARTAYDALTTEGKALVLNYPRLTAAEAAVAAMTTGPDIYSEYIAGTVSNITPLAFGNLVVSTENIVPQNIVIKKYSGVPKTNALSFGASNFYYEITTTDSGIFPATLTFSYSDDSNSADYLDENKFNSLCYYSSGEWKDYQNDNPNPGVVSIDKVNNKVVATVNHFTPIVLGYDLLSPASPNISKVTVNGKDITVEWDKVLNAEGYFVYLSSQTNGPVADHNYNFKSVELTDNTFSFNVDNYGNYYIVVVAVDSYGNVSAIPVSQNQTIVSVPAPVSATRASTSTRAPVASPAPSQAEAATPQPAEPNVVTPPAGDSDGQIKGDQGTNNDTSNNINWTPWIVLFVLILLAGAATGGYFYWFGGEEEVKAIVKEPKKTTNVEPLDKKVENQPKNQNKKSKRW